MSGYNYLSIPERVMMENGNYKQCPVDGSKIVEFYKDKSVLVTGATGFLGKLLVEKLLRVCEEIDTIYVLVRPKKGEDENTRLDKIYGEVIFSLLRELRPKFQHKICLLKGDVSLPDLGLNTIDKQTIIDKVNVIYHIAATVKFDEPIKMATAINIRGTRDLIQLAKQCKNLASFVYVSTAFANCNHKNIDEVFYQPTITCDDLMELVEKTPEEILERDTPKITEGWPNTYAFTKAIAEDAVAKYGKGVPICVFRPSIVIATYREPLRSWIDNVYGATGIIAGAGVGLLHSVHCDGTKAAEMVPADYVINAMIAASYKTAIQKRENISIYNYVSSTQNRIDWNYLMRTSAEHGEVIPSPKGMWCYSLTLNKYKIIHKLYVLLYHFLPALIMDLGLTVTGKKPMMIKVYKKVNKFESVVSHFCTNQWTFSNANTQKLVSSLTDVDREVFPCDITTLDWNDYQQTHLYGLRMYLIKDDPSTIPEARKKYWRLKMMHRILKTVFYLALFRLILWIFTVIYRC